MSTFLTGKGYYPKVHENNYDTPQNPQHAKKWKVSLVLDEASLQFAKDAGMQVREANNYIPGTHVECVRALVSKKGVDQTAPVVVDQNLQPYTDMIGNGSDLKVKIYFNPDPAIGMKHPRLEAIQILNLVQMSGIDSGARAVSGFDVVEGYEEGTQESASDEGTPFETSAPTPTAGFNPDSNGL